MSELLATDPRAAPFTPALGQQDAPAMGSENLPQDAGHLLWTHVRGQSELPFLGA